MARVNQSDLVSTIKARLGSKLKDSQTASDCVDAFSQSLKEAICRGEKVEIRGLGSFSLRQHVRSRGDGSKQSIVNIHYKAFDKMVQIHED